MIIFDFIMTTKAQILHTLKTHKHAFSRFGVRYIGLFGSYVRGEQHIKSDIDLLVDFEEHKATFDNFMALNDLLESIFEGEKIEIVTKNGLSPYIGPKILNEVVYA